MSTHEPVHIAQQGHDLLKSILLGAVILLIADTAARTIISPVVLPVGAITAVLGGPMFLYILMRGTKEKT